VRSVVRNFSEEILDVVLFEAGEVLLELFSLIGELEFFVNQFG
jgi:hypothetical protein